MKAKAWKTLGAAGGLLAWMVAGLAGAVRAGED